MSEDLIKEAKESYSDDLSSRPYKTPKLTKTGDIPLNGSVASIPTPVTDKIMREARSLDKASKYPSSFDYSVYKKLEERFYKKPLRGGIVKRNPLKLVNSHPSCQQCLYALEIDTYGRGCTHNCGYCYAKAELTVYGYWNKPVPAPININEVRKIFYTVFETDKRSKWRDVLKRKVPLRVGCMSDSFMWIDHKYKVSQELLKILKFYQYPHTILTRSDLVAREDYIDLLDTQLSSIQFSISSTNEDLTQKIEPGAPSPSRRLSAVAKLTKAGFWTTVRINPILPIRPDGYFTDEEFSWEGGVPEFNFSSFDMVSDIADTGCKSVILGFGRFSSFALNNMSKATGVNLRPFFDKKKVCKSVRDWHYSDKEIRFYYEEYKKRCNDASLECTVCYIGNGENHFWDHQDLWSNKKDCCNLKGKIPSFKSDSRQIPFTTRATLGTNKNAVPVDAKNLYKKLGEQAYSEKTPKTPK